MNLAHSADIRTLLWSFGLFPALPALAYAIPAAAPYLVPIFLYLGYCAGVLTHNQMHVPMFKARRSNALYEVWLSIFYGFPIFAWIPAHNQNHHRYLNSAEDATRTWRLSNKHTLWNAISYPSLASAVQFRLIAEYVRGRRRSRAFPWLMAQVLAVPVAHAGLLFLAILLYGAALGATTYVLALALPAFYASWSMMFTNYLQHVHCDASSRDNHSRNFVSPWVNWFVFQAGYHTVHHENPTTHWSEYPVLHKKRAAQIAPELNEHSVLSFCFKNYVLGAFASRFRSQQLGAEPARQS